MAALGVFEREVHIGLDFVGNFAGGLGWVGHGGLRLVGLFR